MKKVLQTQQEVSWNPRGQYIGPPKQKGGNALPTSTCQLIIIGQRGLERAKRQQVRVAPVQSRVSTQHVEAISSAKLSDDLAMFVKHVASRTRIDYQSKSYSMTVTGLTSNFSEIVQTRNSATLAEDQVARLSHRNQHRD